MISLLLEPLPDGTPLTDLEFKNFFTLLISAGNDTTRYAIASVASRPRERAAVCSSSSRGADERRWGTAVEEFLRWSSPTMHFRRTAVEDFEMHGRTIRAGDKLILWFISGDYDESVFEDPYRVELARDPNPHMAFGRGGPHACLGMWLARLELRLVLQELVAPDSLHPPDRARGTAAVQLHQRHQVSASGGGPIAGPGGAGGRSR